ncbi:unnamed protein product, partial [Protopolystoma xenopodis]
MLAFSRLCPFHSAFFFSAARPVTSPTEASVGTSAHPTVFISHTQARRIPVSSSAVVDSAARPNDSAVDMISLHVTSTNGVEIGKTYMNSSIRLELKMPKLEEWTLMNDWDESRTVWTYSKESSDGDNDGDSDNDSDGDINVDIDVDIDGDSDGDIDVDIDGDSDGDID